MKPIKCPKAVLSDRVQWVPWLLPPSRILPLLSAFHNCHPLQQECQTDLYKVISRFVNNVVFMQHRGSALWAGFFCIIFDSRINVHFYFTVSWWYFSWWQNLLFFNSNDLCHWIDVVGLNFAENSFHFSPLISPLELWLDWKIPICKVTFKIWKPGTCNSLVGPKQKKFNLQNQI